MISVYLILRYTSEQFTLISERAMSILLYCNRIIQFDKADVLPWYRDDPVEPNLPYGPGDL